MCSCVKADKLPFNWIEWASTSVSQHTKIANDWIDHRTTPLLFTYVEMHVWIPWQTAFYSSNGYTFSVSFFFSPSGRLRNDLHFLPNFNLFITCYLIIFALKNPRRDRGFRMGILNKSKKIEQKENFFLCQLPNVFFFSFNKSLYVYAVMTYHSHQPIKIKPGKDRKNGIVILMNLISMAVNFFLISILIAVSCVAIQSTICILK